MAEMGRERVRHLPNETGGFLIGSRRGHHVEVTGLTIQGPGDVASRTTFERRCPSHAERINAAWRASGAIETMVGDWHSHPRGGAVPSEVDSHAWRQLIRSTGLPMVGIIDAGAAVPAVYLAAARQSPVGIALSLRQSDDEALFFSDASERVGEPSTSSLADIRHCAIIAT